MVASDALGCFFGAVKCRVFRAASFYNCSILKVSKKKKNLKNEKKKKKDAVLAAGDVACLVMKLL